MLNISVIQTRLDYVKQNGWLGYYEAAASWYGIPLEILLAKDSRESWLGMYPGLVANGWIGSDGKSKGISQINANVHDFAKYTDPSDVEAYVAKGAELLKAEYNTFGTWEAALASYNAGSGAVKSAINAGNHPDSVTTGKDYSKDVLEQSEQFKSLLSDNSLTTAIASIVPGTNSSNSIITTALIGSGIVIAIILAKNGYTNSNSRK